MGAAREGKRIYAFFFHLIFFPVYHFLKVDGATELHDEGMDAPRRPNPGGWTYEIFTRKSLSSSTVEI